MQDKPIIRIEIDGFAEDAFEVVKFEGTEAMSTLFQFTITLSSANPTEDFDALLEAKAHLILGEPPVHIRGVLTSVEQSYQGAWKTESGTRTRFDVVLMPEASVMMLTQKTRVYQEKTIPDVVKELIKETGLPGAGISWKVSGTHEKKEFILQYQETDFDFMSRLLEHEGIHYHFEHGDDTEVMVFGDANAAFQPIVGDPDIRLGIPDPALGIPGVGPWGYEQTNTKFQSRQRVVTKKVVLKDYNYRTASLNLKVEGEIKDTKASFGTQYQFADNYLKPGEGNTLRDLRKEEILAGKRIYLGEGTVRRFYPGGKFKLIGVEDIDGALEQEYVITTYTSSGSQPLALAPEKDYEYENHFTCIPESVVFRPERKAPWPEMPGLVHAKVCAPAGGGKYAHVDDKGRYKVQFLFDMEGKSDDKSSCFVRLAENYVGAGFGVHFPLLKDWEVLIAFEYGDPDRPIIVGAVYNSDFPSPVTNANQAQSVWRSSGKNEIRFDDTEGSEHIYVHGQKDWEIKIENDKSQNVGQDESLDVARNRTKHIGADSTETIEANKSTNVGGDHAETISGNQSVNIGASKSETVATTGSETVGLAKTLSVGAAYQVSVGAGMNTTVGAAKGTEVGGAQTVVIGGNSNETVGKARKIVVKDNSSQEVGKEYSLKSKKKMIIESEEEIVLKAGKATITLKKDGTVLIDGKDVTAKASGEFLAKASKDVILKGSKVLGN